MNPTFESQYKVSILAASGAPPGVQVLRPDPKATRGAGVRLGIDHLDVELFYPSKAKHAAKAAGVLGPLGGAVAFVAEPMLDAMFVAVSRHTIPFSQIEAVSHDAASRIISVQGTPATHPRQTWLYAFTAERAEDLLRELSQYLGAARPDLHIAGYVPVPVVLKDDMSPSGRTELSKIIRNLPSATSPEMIVPLLTTRLGFTPKALAEGVLTLYEDYDWRTFSPGDSSATARVGQEGKDVINGLYASNDPRTREVLRKLATLIVERNKRSARLHLWGSLIVLGPAAISGLIFGGFKLLVGEVPDKVYALALVAMFGGLFGTIIFFLGLERRDTVSWAQKMINGRG